VPRGRGAGVRPTDSDSRRYRALVRSLADLGYDQAAAHRHHPFRMADVLFTAVLAAADEVLADLAVVAGHPEAADGHRADAAPAPRRLDACSAPHRSAGLDRDLV